MNLVRSGVDYLRLQHHLYRSSPAALRAFQRRALRRMLDFARERSPFYRQLYSGWSTEDVLRSIPLLADPMDSAASEPPPDRLASTVIDKATMMAHFDTLNTEGLRLADVLPWAVARERAKDYLGYYADRYVVGLSSGTSGNKGIYLTPRSLTERLPAVFLARGGVSLRDLPLRILFLLRVFSQGFADIRAPMLSLRYLSTMTAPESIVDQALSDRTNVLMAPPSLLRVLLPFADRLKGRLNRILCYAEVLEDEEKERFEQRFGAPVSQIYQASEGQIASPCRLGTLHINEDLALVELYDDEGRPVTRPGGTASTMLVTNLVNDVQPLIRYRMNDRVELGGPCACGSSFRTLRRVLGRNDDVLLLRRTTPDPSTGAPTRAVFPDLVSRWIITTDDCIREFHVTVFTPDALEVVLDLLPGTSEARSGQVREEVALRMREELAAFDVVVTNLAVRLAPIRLPVAMQKYRRFVNLTHRQALDHALVRIARAFAEDGIAWGLCSSMLLAMRGLPIEPHDLDLLVSEDGFADACHALTRNGGTLAPVRMEPHPIYGTRCFAEYEVDGVEVDVMAGLSVFGPCGEYRYDLAEGTLDRFVSVEEPLGAGTTEGAAVSIPLTFLGDWFVLYQLIPGRAARTDALEAFFRGEPPVGVDRSRELDRLRATLLGPLPEDIALRVAELARALESEPEGNGIMS
jgi:putative adenylate-forming enzyme